MVAVLALDEGRAPGAGVVAGLGALHLDDVGAEVGQHLARPGAGQDAGEFEDAQTGQRTRHDHSLGNKEPRFARNLWRAGAILSRARQPGLRCVHMACRFPFNISGKITI